MLTTPTAGRQFDPEKVREVIRRLEAREVSRELDAVIACAFVFRNHRPARPDDFDGKYGYQPGTIFIEDSGFLTADPYTRSLDEAMSLCETLHPGSGASAVHLASSLAIVHAHRSGRETVGAAEIAREMYLLQLRELVATPCDAEVS